MTKPKTNLNDLTTRTLRNRLTTMNINRRSIEEVLAKREQQGIYRPDAANLKEYNVDVDVSFVLTVKAIDEDEADSLANNTDWIMWYANSPGDVVAVDDCSFYETRVHISNDRKAEIAVQTAILEKANANGRLN